MELKVTVRESDEVLLKELAEQQWRTEAQQASALIESVLAAQRARAGGTAGRPRGRKPGGPNGHVTEVSRGRAGVASE